MRTNEELMGHLAMAATGYFQDIVLSWVAGSLLHNLVHLVYCSTTYYCVQMLFRTILNCIL